MTQYNNVYVKLLASQFDKLKSVAQQAKFNEYF